LEEVESQESQIRGLALASMQTSCGRSSFPRWISQNLRPSLTWRATRRTLISHWNPSTSFINRSPTW